MNELRYALQEVLQNDSAIQVYVGRDEDNAVKVYETLAKSGIVPPFVVWHLVPGIAPEGTFKDRRAIEQKQFQVTAWGRSQSETWALWEVIQQALESDWYPYTLPYRRVMLRRLGDEQLLPDLETKWLQVPTTYNTSLSR